jgi:hypothetical protein
LCFLPPQVWLPISYSFRYHVASDSIYLADIVLGTRISNFRYSISREQEMRYMFFYLDITEDIVAQWGVMVDPQVLSAHI